MKKICLTACTMLALLLWMHTSALAQQKSTRKKQIVEMKAITTPMEEVSELKRPANDKNPKPETKTRGDIYGPDYSDIIIANYTGFLIDIYINNEYRGTIGAYDKRVTWAVPGNTRLYAKAVFDDGSYIYWGPYQAKTGYEYTWKLY